MERRPKSAASSVRTAATAAAARRSPAVNGPARRIFSLSIRRLQRSLEVPDGDFRSLIAKFFAGGSGTETGWKRRLAHSSNLLNMIHPLVPPNPNELDIAQLMGSL